MRHFLIAYAAFLAAHMVPAIPALRRQLVTMVGERRYLVLYSILSLALVAWLITAARAAPFVAIWTVPPAAYAITRVVAPLGLILATIGLFSANPLSVTLNRGGSENRFGAITAITRHPVLWGFGLWALAHLAANGDLVLAMLFGGFVAFAFGGMVLVDLKKRRQFGSERWQALAAAAPVLGWSGASSGIDRRAVDAGLIAGLLLGGGFVIWLFHGGHGALIGVEIPV
ncbi:MAG: NnrU family protein [Hyphomicrobiales bacterium]|nr:NnrU family protein [Hyphomicrobiales bacterium]